MSRPQCPRCHRAFLPGLYEMHIRGCGTAQERASLTEWCAFVRSSPGGLGSPDHMCPCDKLQNWLAQSPAPSRDDLTYALVYSVRHGQQDACELLLAAGADINGSVPGTPLNMGIIHGEEMARFVLLKGGRVCNGEVKVAGLYGHFDCVKLMVAIGGTFNEDDIAAILERGESNKEEIVRFLREEAPLLRAHAIVKRQCRGVDAAQVSDGGAAATHSEAAAAESSPAPTPAEAAPSSSASASPASASASSPPRIMLSYQWDHQPLVKRLAERIKQSGYHVWLDVEQMSGSTLEAMAGAVEGSSAVVMCLSAKYQASRNCRLEGEYAHLVSKPIVPVLLTPWPWRATSWLGLITGSKLYFDFTEDAQFEAKVAELLAELHRTVGPPSGSHAALPAGASSQAAASSSAALPSAVAAPAAAVASASSAASACAPAPVSAASASDSSATVESKWLLDTHGIALRQPLDAACLQELHKLQDKEGGMSMAWLEFLVKHIVHDMKSALKLSHVLSTRVLPGHRV